MAVFSFKEKGKSCLNLHYNDSELNVLLPPIVKKAWWEQWMASFLILSHSVVHNFTPWISRLAQLAMRVTLKERRTAGREKSCKLAISHKVEPCSLACGSDVFFFNWVSKKKRMRKLQIWGLREAPLGTYEPTLPSRAIRYRTIERQIQHGEPFNQNCWLILIFSQKQPGPSLSSAATCGKIKRSFHGSPKWTSDKDPEGLWIGIPQWRSTLNIPHYKVSLLQVWQWQPTKDFTSSQDKKKMDFWFMRNACVSWTEEWAGCDIQFWPRLSPIYIPYSRMRKFQAEIAGIVAQGRSRNSPLLVLQLDTASGYLHLWASLK